MFKGNKIVVMTDPYCWPHPYNARYPRLGSFAIQHSFVYGMVDATKVVLFGMPSIEETFCGAVSGLRAVQRTDKSGTLILTADSIEIRKHMQTSTAWQLQTPAYSAMSW